MTGTEKQFHARLPSGRQIRSREGASDKENGRAKEDRIHRFYSLLMHFSQNRGIMETDYMGKQGIIMPKKILIVEDEANIRELLRLYLEREGYAVIEAENGVEGIKQWKSEKPDMILLDVMMPVMDGWAVCKEIRAESDVPIIMLTAKGETADRVSGLEMGADDYIVKPLEMPEVIARVRAVFRRMVPDEAPEKLFFDNLVIDKQAYDLVIRGKRVDAPPKEIELLYYLASSPNRVFTRAQLLDDVWGFDYFGDTRTVDVHVKRLREKLEGVSDKWELKTVWGVGYKFETKE